jgi:hypothetical protein
MRAGAKRRLSRTISLSAPGKEQKITEQAIKEQAMSATLTLCARAARLAASLLAASLLSSCAAPDWRQSGRTHPRADEREANREPGRESAREPVRESTRESARESAREAGRDALGQRGRNEGRGDARPDASAGQDQAALREGMRLYDEGDFQGAIKRLGSNDIRSNSALRIRLAALKYTAFSYCVTARARQCEQSFEKALKLDPGFALEPGEQGHPLWGPAFERAKRD